MVQFATSGMMLSGDIGGAGMSRFHWQRQDATPILPADCNSAAAAIHNLFSSCGALFPSAVTWTYDPTVSVREVDTGALDAELLTGTVPSPVTGGSSGDYAAGVGARIQWKSSSVRNRRFMRSWTAFVPLGNSAFGTNGAISSTAIGIIDSAAATLLAALNTAQLEMIVWHRPPKHTFVGGAAGLVTAFFVGTQPMGLRSRRS